MLLCHTHHPPPPRSPSPCYSLCLFAPCQSLSTADICINLFPIFPPIQGNATLHLYPHFEPLRQIEGKPSSGLSVSYLYICKYILLI